MRTWGVTVPIAGHAYIVVEAETEDEAIDRALDEVTTDHLDSWESLRQFNQGNVCYCPSPWEAEAVDETIEDD